GRDRLHGADLGGGQAETAELVAARAPHSLVMERVEGGGEAAPDRSGAGGRKLLRADDAASPGKPPGRLRNGGSPATANTGPMRGSSAISAATLAFRSASVWMKCGMGFAQLCDDGRAGQVRR